MLIDYVAYPSRSSIKATVCLSVWLVCILPAWTLAAEYEADNEVLDTFRPYVRAEYGYDSNLFRIGSDAQARALLGTTDTSETYHRLGAGLDMDWRISRQLLIARLDMHQTRYDTYKQLDYSGRAALLQWNWLSGKYASGDIGISDNRTLASFNEVQRPTQNLLKTRQAYAHAGVKLQLPWQLNFGIARISTDNSAISQQVLDYNENKYSTGIQYQTEKGTLLEYISQYRQGQYPNRQIVATAPVDNDYRQYDNGVALSWAPSAKTQLKSQLNYTQRKYDDVPQRNFSGATGRLAAEWLFSGKTTLGLDLYRDIGVVENNTASYSLNRGLALHAKWRPTAKLTFKAQAAHERQTYSGDPGFVLTNTAAREDDITQFQLETQYQVLRKTKLALLLQQGDRESNQALAGYRFHSAFLGLRSEF